MNRIESLRSSSLLHPFQGKPSKASHPKRSRNWLEQSPVAIQFPHRVFAPEHYEPGYDYPLVVWLHSDKSSEHEIDLVMPGLSMRNYVAVSLRGPQRAASRKRVYDWRLSPGSIALTEECLFESIEKVAESMSIRKNRIFLAGMGKGGTLAQYFGLRHPDRFAGVLSINGPFPTIPRSLIRWKETKDLPILWMHGNASEQCGMDAMCSMLETAYSAALKVFPVQFAAGDEMNTQMLKKMNRFMMQIVTGEPICMHEQLLAE